MATKQRHKIIPVGDHTDKGVARYASDYGLGKREAELQLIQYALNRIATLERYESSKPKKPKAAKKAKPKAEKPKAAKKAKPKAEKPKAEKPKAEGTAS